MRRPYLSVVSLFLALGVLDACRSAPTASPSDGVTAVQAAAVDSEHRACGAAIREHGAWFAKVQKCYNGTERVDLANYCAEQFKTEHEEETDEAEVCAGLPTCEKAFAEHLKADRTWIECRSGTDTTCREFSEADRKATRRSLLDSCRVAQLADSRGSLIDPDDLLLSP